MLIVAPVLLSIVPLPVTLEFVPSATGPVKISIRDLNRKCYCFIDPTSIRLYSRRYCRILLIMAKLTCVRGPTLSICAIYENGQERFCATRNIAMFFSLVGAKETGGRRY